MDNARHRQETKLVDCHTRQRISVYRNVDGSRSCKSDDYPKDNRNEKRYRKYVHLLSVSLLVSAACPAFGADVGGVSATANPVATSSGSVTNQAIQVLQGPYLTNTYGGGIQCQGPTLNVTPFVTNSNSFQKPFEAYYKDPVYDVSDRNDDGIIDNPGKILYFKDVRTAQKNSHSLNAGLSATISFPLDRSLQDRCKKAVDAQISLQEQTLANRRLDFEIARLKNCGELAMKGITFHPKSPYFDVCKDVVVRQPADKLPQHYHPIVLEQAEENESRDSDPAEKASSHKHSQPSGAVVSTKQSSSLSSSQ